MSRPLTISIPTYNRLGYLRLLLEEILPECEKLDIEVCVSDNGSADGTRDYLSSIRVSSSVLKIQLNDENIGIDRNMLAVARMSTSEYVYLLGDDDFLPHDCMEHLLDTLRGSHDVVLLNAWHTDSYLNRLRQHLGKSLSDKVFTVPSEAFEAAWDKMPFGSFICRTEIFLQSADTTKYIGTSHAYTGEVWDYLASKYSSTDSIKFLCDGTPSVFLRGAQKTWRTQACRILLLEIIAWFRLVAQHASYADICQSIEEHYKSQQLKLLPLVSHRGSGQLPRSFVRELTPYYSTVQQARITLVSVLPVCLCRMMSRVGFWARAVLRPTPRRVA